MGRPTSKPILLVDLHERAPIVDSSSITVNTRNAGLYVPIDPNVRNWVTDYVTNISTNLNKKLDLMANSMRYMMLKLAYLATDFVKIHGEDVAWNVYEESIAKMFGPLNEDPMVELKYLKYEATMKEYQSQFEKLVTQVDISETQFISMFIVGFPANIELCMYASKISPGEGDYDLDLSESQEEEFTNKNQELFEIEYPEISLNALTGVPTFNTMRVGGNVGKHLLHMLYDTGSTYNFLDLFNAKKLGCNVDVMLLPLEGCEMVLGIQWLSTLGIIEWNFKEPVMKFVYEGKKMCLMGTRKSELQWMSGKKLHKKSLPSMSCFEDVFAIPYALPPQRSFDHKIPLKDESTVVNIRPYRYLPNQKNVIEAMVNELMETGVVRQSHNPYSSPIVLTNKEHTLFAKQSKCMFGTTHVEYLGHIISKQGVATNPEKIKAMQNWPIPTTLKQLREAQTAFEKLQQAMTEASVLTLPNFQAELVILTNASGYDIGVVLQQNNHPIAFLSKTLAPKHQSLSAYAKELSAVRITTHFQSKWLPNWLRFDYEIEYKQGKDNVVVDALSRTQSQGELFALLSASTSNEFMNAVTKLWTTDPMLKTIVEKLQNRPVENFKYTWHDQQLRRKGKWVVGADDQLRKTMVVHFHTSAIGGHSGVQATLKRIRAFFYWKGMRKMVKEIVRTCDVCQRNKADLSAYPGLLQPLPTQTQALKRTFKLSLKSFALILSIPCEGECSYFEDSSLDSLRINQESNTSYQTHIPTPNEIVQSITTTGQPIFPNKILKEELRHDMRSWNEIIQENAFGIQNKSNFLPASSGHMIFVINESLELSNESYVLYDRVMNPLTTQQERKTRKDHGTRRGRHSTSSSSAFDQPSSSHLNDDDDDENSEGTSHASTPSLIRFVNSLTNEILDDPCNEDVTTTPSPTTTSSSPTPPNAPSKTPSTNQTSSSQENTFSSFQSKLQISPPSSNEPTSPQPLNPLFDNISDVPPRPLNSQPLQSHPSLDITLSLLPITPLDHILDTLSPPSPRPPPQPPLTGHPNYFNYYDYHGSTCLCFFLKCNLIFSLRDKMDLMFAHIEYLLTSTMNSLSPPHP
ncbi:putative mitochondrial protein [Tanacetum coccineum]